MAEETRAPLVSIVVPARNEAGFLGDCLASLESIDTDEEYETIVVDGDSDDETPEIARRFDVQLVQGDGSGIGAGRHLGARRAAGDWLAFVDADTTVVPSYLEELLAFVRQRDLIAATSRCRMPGLRSVPMRATINQMFPRLPRPILPGFNTFVDAEAYSAVGGFPNVPNEDTAFSRRLSTVGDVEYHPDALVETSPRRIQQSGLTGTLYHYLRLDVGRLRAEY
jgi:glycosyltransferase involved in cell wall biosynthesis